MPGERIESILAADCGSVFSKTTLIDKVDGEFRFVAMGESLTTPDNMSEGLAEAVRDIEMKTGRKLLRGLSLATPEDQDGDGVDAAVLACSAGRPIRLITAGVSPSQSSLDASEVAARALADVVASVCIQDIRHKGKAEEKLTEMQEAQADAIVFVAGWDSGGHSLLTEVSEFIAEARLVGRNGSRLPVIIAGSPASFEAVSKVLTGFMDVEAVGPVRTASGSYRIQPGASALNDLYFNRQILGLPGLGSLASDKWSTIVAAPKAIGNVAEFVARQVRTDVLMVDLGATTATAVAVIDRRSDIGIMTNCGMGTGIYGVLAATNAEELVKWLPFESEAEQVLEVGLNRGLRPQTVAQLPEELLIEEAIARTAIRYAIRRVSVKSGMVIASGGFFSHLPRYGRLMLLLLDAIQPYGVTRIACDPLGMIPSLGAMAVAFPQAAGEVIMKDALQHLGTAVTLVGSGKVGPTAARVKVHYTEGREFQIEVPSGGIEVIPLHDGQKANLLVQLAPEFHLGDSPKGHQVEVEVSGGAVGIVIDARGRPLDLPSEPHQRIRKLSDWYRALDK